MSHTETRVLTSSAEVILLSGDGGNHKALSKAAGSIHAHTGALVIVDHLGTSRISSIDPAEMRRHGWVRIEELERARSGEEAAP